MAPAPVVQRPSLVAADKHHQHPPIITHHHQQNEIFPRRYPKIGGAYQCKSIPQQLEDIYINTRTGIPERMSTDIPHCTENEVIMNSSDNNNNNINNTTIIQNDIIIKEKTIVVPPSTTTTTTRGYETSRGGALVHRANTTNNSKSKTNNNRNNNDNNLWFTNYSQLNPIIDNNNWYEQVHTWYQQQKQNVENEFKRKSRYKKRPAPIDPPLPKFEPSLCNNNDNSVINGVVTTTNTTTTTTNESDDITLEFLWRQHGGNQYQASLACLTTDWTYCHGNRSILRQRKKMKKDCSSTINWRTYVLNTYIHVTGNLAVHDNQKRTGKTIEFSTTIPDPNSNDSESLCQAILDCAKSVQEKLKTTDHNIYLSTLFCFMQKVAIVPFVGINNSMIKNEIDTIMQEFVTYIDIARYEYSKLVDLWGQKQDGVDIDTIQKQINIAEKASIIKLDGLDEMKRQVSVVQSWQNRLDEAYEHCNNTINNYDSADNVDTNNINQRDDLWNLEQLIKQGKLHGFRSKGFVMLEHRVNRAYEIRDRILEWKQNNENENNSKENIKFIAAIVRDIHRLKIRFPIVNEMLLFHSKIELWVERANIAIRSRICLHEIQDLIHRGNNIPLDLSEFLDKLQNRVDSAIEWLHKFFLVIPCSNNNDNNKNYSDTDIDKITLIRQIRHILVNNSGQFGLLHELATEGSRVPVEVEIVKLLQLELDAFAWSTKTKKLLDDDSKRSKLEDLREHATKAISIHERLVLSKTEKQEWVLDGEIELQSVLDSADIWIENSQSIINNPAPATTYTIRVLRDLVRDGNAINANLGYSLSKVERIVSQAESWYDKYYLMLVHCNIVQEEEPSQQQHNRNSAVTLAELSKAVEEATSDVNINLDEAAKLDELVKIIKDWNYRASLATGAKRQQRGKKLVFTMDDIRTLINEANGLPVDTCTIVSRLNEMVCSVEQWQARVSTVVNSILTGFQEFRDALNEMYGLSAEYKRVHRNCNTVVENDNMHSSSQGDNDVILRSTSKDVFTEHKTSDDASAQCDATVSTAPSDQDVGLLASFGNDFAVFELIRSFCKDSNMSGIVTPEKEIASYLEKVSRWCLRSVKYLENQRDVFDKRFFGAFDRFLKDGRALAEKVNGISAAALVRDDSASVLKRVRYESGKVVADQLERLNVLLSDRKDYVALCSRIDKLLNSEERRPTLDKLTELSEKSMQYPGSNDLILKLRNLTQEATSWAEEARSILTASNKLSMADVTAFLKKGENIGFACVEMRNMRSGLLAARNWSKRVKRCNLDQGEVQRDKIQPLLDEHEALIVDLRDETKKLHQAVKHYCLCRRPYDGFMIACDECDDWFHGPCIGVSETKADRVNKYVCIRCSLKKTYHSSASAIVDIIRKWTNKSDLKKARQADLQKHKRRVRKENKDIEKYQKKALELRQQLILRFGSSEPGMSAISAKGISAAKTDEKTILSTSGPEQAQVVPTAVSNAAGNSVVVCPAVHGSLDGKSGTDKKLESCKTVTDIDDSSSSRKENVSEGTGNSVSKRKTEELSREKLQEKIEKLAVSIQSCVTRLSDLSASAAALKREESFEDANKELLLNWVLNVRSLLIPSTKDQAMAMKPSTDGKVPQAIFDLEQEAKFFGLQSISDVKNVLNYFHCIFWCYQALNIFARQPTSVEMSSLVSKATKLVLPDEKALRMIKAMAQRASSWESKVSKVLKPVPGERKSFNLKILKELAMNGDDIPVYMPLEQRLMTVIDDEGCRHCLCGGPSDGRFMLACDGCDRWFHGHCVSIDKNTSESDLNDWKCPFCSGSADSISLEVEHFHEKYDAEPEKEESVATKRASKAALKDLWPPFGLFGSARSKEVLGKDCCDIPDRTSFSRALIEAGAQPYRYVADVAMSGGHDTVQHSVPIGFQERSSNANAKSDDHPMKDWIGNAQHVDMKLSAAKVDASPPNVNGSLVSRQDAALLLEIASPQSS